MSTKKVKFIAFALMAVLTAGWIQPVFAHACSSVGTCNEGAFSAGVSTMGEANCVSVQNMPAHHKPAGHDGSGHDSAGHGTSAQTAGSKQCMMKACSLSAYVPPLTQYTDFSPIATESGFIAVYGDDCLPSPHLSALFRPPRLTTLWG